MLHRSSGQIRTRCPCFWTHTACVRPAELANGVQVPLCKAGTATDLQRQVTSSPEGEEHWGRRGGSVLSCGPIQESRSFSTQFFSDGWALPVTLHAPTVLLITATPRFPPWISHPWPLVRTRHNNLLEDTDLIPFSSPLLTLKGIVSDPFGSEGSISQQRNFSVYLSTQTGAW